MSGRDPRPLVVGLALVLVLAACAGFLIGLSIPASILLLAGIAVVALMCPSWALWAILVGFLVHPLAARVLQFDFGVTGTALVIFSAWKELALGCVVLAEVWEVFRLGRRVQLRRLTLMDWFAIGLIVLIAVGLVRRHDALAFNYARLLLFPVGVFIAVRLADLNAGRYLTATTATAVLVALLGVYESTVLGWSFVQHYWSGAGGSVPDTFTAQYLVGPRASGTLASPNELGFLLALGVIMAASLIVTARLKGRYPAALLVLVVGLASTFSRSAIVGSGAGLVLLVVVVVISTAGRARRLVLLSLAAALIPAMLISGMIYAERGGLSLISSTFTSIGATIDNVPSAPSPGTASVAPFPKTSASPAATEPSTPPVDPSTVGHFQSLSAGWSLVQSTPLGLGPGTVGSRPDPGDGEKPTYIFESWYLAMAVSLGWAALAWSALFPLALLLAGWRAYRHHHSAIALAQIGIAVVVGGVSLLLPTMSEPQLAMIPWTVAALTAPPIVSGARSQAACRRASGRAKTAG